MLTCNSPEYIQCTETFLPHAAYSDVLIGNKEETGSEPKLRVKFGVLGQAPLSFLW